MRFYGEHSSMWVRQDEVELPPEDEEEHLRHLRTVGRQQNKCVFAFWAISRRASATWKRRVGACWRGASVQER